jgi:hypothetical protein
MTRLALSLALTLAAGVVAAGCGDPSRRGATAASVQNQAVSTPGPGPGAPASGQPPGIVRQLTGDPDDQVESEVQGLVRRGDALGEADAPLDF